MAWTAPKTWASGPLTAAELNEQIRDNENWLKDALTTHGITSDSTVQVLLGARYGVSLTKSNESVNASIDKPIQFDTEEWDDASFHSGSNPGRITFPTAGTYHIIAWAEFENEASGRRDIWIEHDDGTPAELNRKRQTANSNAELGMGTEVYLEVAASDFVRCMVRHTANTSLNVTARFQAVRVAV